METNDFIVEETTMFWSIKRIKKFMRNINNSKTIRDTFGLLVGVIVVLLFGAFLFASIYANLNL